MHCFKYLDFIFNRREDYMSNIRELRLKGRTAANRIWGLGNGYIGMIF